MRITLWPVGPTRRTSMSFGKEWVNPFRLTRTFETTPLAPATVSVDGYGDAVVLSAIKMPSDWE
jgi:hypothetical protein